MLYGFTITGGSGTRSTYVDPDFGPGVMRQGGGIFVNSSGANIRNNIIRDNTIQSDLYATEEPVFVPGLSRQGKSVSNYS